MKPMDQIMCFPEETGVLLLKFFQDAAEQGNIGRQEEHPDEKEQDTLEEGKEQSQHPEDDENPACCKSYCPFHMFKDMHLPWVCQCDQLR